MFLFSSSSFAIDSPLDRSLRKNAKLLSRAASAPVLVPLGAGVTSAIKRMWSLTYIMYTGFAVTSGDGILVVLSVEGAHGCYYSLTFLAVYGMLF
jgi:hypothetical protein